jgi:stress-induced-phosphoprotein 1
MSCTRRKDFDNAIVQYNKAIELEPKNLMFRSNLIAVLTEKKEYDKALEACVEAEKVYAETDYKERKLVDIAKVYARHARIYELQEKFDESIEYYNKSLLENKEYKVDQDMKRVKALKKQREDNSYINPALGDEARDRGNKLFADGKFSDALVEYLEATRRNPKDAKSFNNRATCYVKLMEFNMAMKEVDKALEIDPHFVKALVRKASIHHVLKEYHKAIQCCETALKFEPNDESAKEQLQKTKIAIAGGMHSTEGNDEERMRRAMADPEIQQIMMDPMLKIALGKMQEDPRGASQYFTDPNLGPKLQKLIQAGILKVA